MVLASQYARPGRHKLPPRRRRRKRTIIGIVVLTSLTALAWMLANSERGEGDDTQQQQASLDQAPVGVSAPGTAREAEKRIASRNAAINPDPEPPKRLAAPPPIATTVHRTDPSEVRPRPASRLVATNATVSARRDTKPAALPPIVPGDPNAWREVRERLENNIALVDPEHPIESRRWLTDALVSLALAPDEQAIVRAELTSLNDRLVFSREVVEGDPYSLEHIVEPGATLSKIVEDLELQVDWRLILRVNGISKAPSIRAGQRLKMVRGPFHVVVSKPDYRMDLYLGSGYDRVYVRSFAVGLGTKDKTPIGMFCVKRTSKLINPAWVNPITHEVYAPDDPANPIGERWIGLTGIEPATRDKFGFGIHGTIEPETVGTQASMGCIRMHPDDVALIYEVLMEVTSTVEIAP